MNVLVRLVEGAPLSYVVVLFALLALSAAVAQLVKRDRDLSGLVFGALATLGLLTIASVAESLSILELSSWSDPATIVVLIARAASSSLAVVYFAGSMGTVAALLGTLACVVVPHRRAESALRGLAFAVGFGASFAAAWQGERFIEAIAGADESAKGTMMRIAIGGCCELLALGLFVATVLMVAAAVVSVRGARASA